MENVAVVARCEALLGSIHESYYTTLADYLRTKSRADRQGSGVPTPWVELHHAIGRLMSYPLALEFIISARKEWPELFLDFELIPVPSSQPDQTPSTRRSSQGIMDRLTTVPDVINAFQRQAEFFEEMELDKLIKEKSSYDNFRPYVHAEMILHDAIRRAEAEARVSGEDPLRFFNEADFGRYIGCSKPSCLACWLWCGSHPSGITIRSTHGNPYLEWAVPSVYAGEADALKERKDTLETVIKGLKNGVTRAITSGSVKRNPFDSNNSPSNPRTIVNDLCSRISQMNMGPDPPTDSERSSRGETPDFSDSTLGSD